MTPLRKFLLPAVLISAVLVGCTSGSTTSTGTDATTTTSSTTTTVVGDATTTSAAATTTPATAAQVTTPPTTTPAPQIFTSFSVSDVAACTDPTAPYQPPPPAATISWTVVGADSVNLLIDGGLWGPYGLSGSESLPASCDATLHNVHTFSAVAIKNGQEIARKSKQRGH